MVRIVIVNGMPTSGKSTFVEYCLEKLGVLGREISTVDFVKELATMAGWSGTKTPRDRRFLSDLKDLLTEWNDVPFKKIKEAKEFFEDDLARYDMEDSKVFLFVHCREPYEIQKIKDRLGAVTVLIRREEVEGNDQSNHADRDVFDFKYDIVIDNNKGLNELKKQAEGFIKLITM